MPCPKKPDVALATDIDVRDLLEQATRARERAYVPYSQFAVGAVVMTDDGSLFTGANVENASFGLTICAERSAIFSAISAGHRRIRSVAIIAAPAGLDRDPSELKPVPPCGACRQVMVEFMDDSGMIILGEQDVYRVGDLLPQAFGVPR